MVELPGRGLDVRHRHAGPGPDSPTIVLLHAVGCTGLLTWFPSIEPLSRRFRVVTLDQRWHGRGIQREEFSLHDCADDVAALVDVLGPRGRDRRRLLDGLDRRPAGLAPAPRAGRRPGAVRDHRPVPLDPRRAAVLHQDWRRAMLGTRGLSRSRTAVRARPRGRRRARPGARPTCTSGRSRSSAAPARGRSARRSPRSGRHHSRPWLGRIDVPTAVVVTSTTTTCSRRAPDRAAPPDPRRDHPRHRRRPRRLRAGVRAVRAGVPRGGRHRQRAAPRLPATVKATAAAAQPGARGLPSGMRRPPSCGSASAPAALPTAAFEARPARPGSGARGRRRPASTRGRR